MKTLYLCGSGNPEGVSLALRVNERHDRWERIVLLDDDPATHGGRVLGVEVAGPFELLRQQSPESAEVVNLVARTTERRWRAYHRIRGFGARFTSLVEPGILTDGAGLADDVLVFVNVSVCAASCIGAESVALMGAVVGHGSKIGRGCVLAPNAVINARVVLGDGVYVGSNATIMPDVVVGAWATVGAGSVAMQDVPEGATVMGVPGRVLPTASSRIYDFEQAPD